LLFFMDVPLNSTGTTYYASHRSSNCSKFLDTGAGFLAIQIVRSVVLLRRANRFWRFEGSWVLYFLEVKRLRSGAVRISTISFSVFYTSIQAIYGAY
jgi:hypothetical protein